MEKFYNFNLNLNAINNGCNSQFLVANTGGKNSVKAEHTKDSDTFQNSKKDNKKYIIFGPITVAVLVLSIYAKTDKLKKLLHKIKPDKFSKIQATQGITTKAVSVETQKAINAVLPQKDIKESKTLSPKTIAVQEYAPKTTKTQNIPKTKRRKAPKIKNLKPVKTLKNIPDQIKTRIEIIQPHVFKKPQDIKGIEIYRTNNKQPKNLASLAISNILKKNKLTRDDLNKIEETFKNYTGISLYCPDKCHLKDFNNFFDLMLNGKFYQKMDSNIKHIIAAHGIGSAQAGNWRFLGTRKNVFDFIAENIPKGDTVLAMVCEETVNRIRPGLGTPVNITLQQADKPGKIIKAGERQIIGTITRYSPKIQYF